MFICQTFIGNKRDANTAGKLGHAIDVPRSKRLLRSVNAEWFKPAEKSEGIVELHDSVGVDTKTNVFTEALCNSANICVVRAWVDANLHCKSAKTTIV